MAKLLLLVIVGAVVYFIVKGYGRSLGREQQVQRARPAEEDMVRCLRCGVHLPRSESVASQGNYFCSEEHRRLHAS